MLPRKLYTMPQLQHWKGTQLTCLLYLQISPQSSISFLTLNHCFPAFQKLLKSSKIDFHLFLWPFFLSLSFPPSSSSPYIPTQQASASWPHYLPEDDLELLLLNPHLGGGLQVVISTTKHILCIAENPAWVSVPDLQVLYPWAKFPALTRASYFYKSSLFFFLAQDGFSLPIISNARLRNLLCHKVASKLIGRNRFPL